MKTLTATLTCALSDAALAGNRLGTGQPGVECEDIHPGQSASGRGSASTENCIAGTAYIGEQIVNSRNPKLVSQYNVTCSSREARQALV
jgi:hypothetical protein